MVKHGRPHLQILHSSEQFSSRVDVLTASSGNTRRAEADTTCQQAFARNLEETLRLARETLYLIRQIQHHSAL
jgi:hypothetical protein